jgi:hypothetical protein
MIPVMMRSSGPLKFGLLPPSEFGFSHHTEIEQSPR